MSHIEICIRMTQLHCLSKWHTLIESNLISQFMFALGYWKGNLKKLATQAPGSFHANGKDPILQVRFLSLSTTILDFIPPFLGLH